jgi:hypothetical protein
VAETCGEGLLEMRLTRTPARKVSQRQPRKPRPSAVFLGISKQETSRVGKTARERGKVQEPLWGVGMGTIEVRIKNVTEHQVPVLAPIIPATQEAEIRRFIANPSK